MSVSAAPHPKVGRVIPNAPTLKATQNESTLPAGWRWLTVADMVERIQYGTSAKTGASDSGVPVIRMGNIQEGTLLLDSLKYLPERHDEFPELLLRDGDLLFNRTNSSELVGKSAVYRGNLPRASFASYLIRAQLKPDYVPEFLAYYINSPHGRQWVSSVVSQQVGQANVNGTKLKALRVPVPPLPEQRRTVAEIEKQFTRLDAGVAALRRTQANLKRYRAAVLKAACEGRLVPTEHDLQSGSGVPPLGPKQKRQDAASTLAPGDFDSLSRGSNPSPSKRGSIPRGTVPGLIPLRSTDYETGEQLLSRLLAERR